MSHNSLLRLCRLKLTFLSSGEFRYPDYPTENPDVILHFSPVGTRADWALDTPLARQVITDTAAQVAARQPATDVVSLNGEIFTPNIPPDPKTKSVWRLFIANACGNQAFTWQVAAQAAAAYKKWAVEQTTEGVYAPVITLRNPKLAPRQPGFVVGFMGLQLGPAPGVVQGGEETTAVGPAQQAIEALKGDCSGDLLAQRR